MSKKFITLFLESDGGVYTDETGSKCLFNLSPTINLDPSKKYYAALHSSSIPYCEFNITTENNYFCFKYNNQVRFAWIEPGLYSVSSLDARIALLCQSIGIPKIITLEPSESDGKIIIRNNVLLLTIYFDNDQNGTKSIFTLCGFTNIHPLWLPTQLQSFIVSDEIASFDNALKQINICASFCNGSDSYANGISGDIIGSIIPNVESFSKIINHENHLKWVEVITNTISSFTISLKNQLNKPLNFNIGGRKESWFVCIQIAEEGQLLMR